MGKLSKVLKELDEWKEEEHYFLYGNPINPNLAVIFEKAWVFQIAVKAFGDPHKHLFVCTVGIPSLTCLKFIKTIKAKRLIYLGDLDPTSLYIFLTLSHAKRIPKPKDKPKLKIEYGGVTFEDQKHFYTGSPLIKMDNAEKAVLDWIEKFRLPKLKQETEFLKRTGMKAEIEGICQCWKIVQGDGYIYCKFQREKVKDFENYLKSKFSL